MIANGYYYNYWNHRKFRLSDLGLFVLECIKEGQEPVMFSQANPSHERAIAG